VLVIFTSLCALAARSAGFDHGYARLGRVLGQHAQNGRVDYAALQRAPAELDAALDEMASVARGDFEMWPQSQQIAFLLNLYNASTLRLILNHYPVGSIKDIGHILRGPFKQRTVRLFAETTTLDHVEHAMLRAQYREPRVHFALVCAAKSCPPLRHEPYVSERLDVQLDDQGKVFLGDRARNRFDASTRVLHLSPIFKWFREDFDKHSGSVVKFITPFFPADVRRDLAAARTFEIRYTDYDWSLNDKPR
jgi:hypothetical protein